MTRKTRVTAAERRALRLEAWGGGPSAQGYCDGYDLLPPNPPADSAAARHYQMTYRWGLERRGPRAAAGEAG